MVSRIVAGRLFQVRGPATSKARSSILVLVLGTKTSDDFDDRSRDLLQSSDSGLILSAKLFLKPLGAPVNLNATTYLLDIDCIVDFKTVHKCNELLELDNVFIFSSYYKPSFYFSFLLKLQTFSHGRRFGAELGGTETEI